MVDGLAHVDFPGSSPYVLSVGGTTIPAKGGNGADIVWKEGSGLRSSQGGSTGGGVSAMLPCPDWQKNVSIQSVNPGVIAGRCVPDVAANADWKKSPYLLVVDGKPQPTRWLPRRPRIRRNVGLGHPQRRTTDFGVAGVTRGDGGQQGLSDP